MGTKLINLMYSDGQEWSWSLDLLIKGFKDDQNIVFALKGLNDQQIKAVTNFTKTKVLSLGEGKAEGLVGKVFAEKVWLNELDSWKVSKRREQTAGGILSSSQCALAWCAHTSDKEFNNNKVKLSPGYEEKAQQLRALNLPEDLGLVPRTPMAANNCLQL